MVGNYSDLYEDWYYSDDFTLSIQQFTGLKDKNGKEIYEGDILNRKNAGYKYVVEYSTEEAAFISKDKNGNYVYLPDFLGNIEVVGNIFENKELLEK